MVARELICSCWFVKVVFWEIVKALLSGVREIWVVAMVH